MNTIKQYHKDEHTISTIFGLTLQSIIYSFALIFLTDKYYRKVARINTLVYFGIIEKEGEDKNLEV